MDDIAVKLKKNLARESEGIIPTDGVPWIDASHQVDINRLLTFDDPRAENPKGFKGNLYDPQKTMLAAMIALEQRSKINTINACIETRMGRVSEKFSFGKTVLSIALVCATNKHVVSDSKNIKLISPICDVIKSIDSLRSYPEITVHYTKQLQTTIVLAAATIISQWEINASQFTDLKYFTIENVRSLRKFEELYRCGKGGFDLIFIKSGRVTTSFIIKGETERGDKSKNRSLIEAVSLILEGVTVARLIIDDYDMLKLSNDDCFIPAAFTWIVSATRRNTIERKKTFHKPFASVEDFFRSRVTPNSLICNASLDDTVNKVFNLQCSPEYVNGHIHSTIITFRRIIVKGTIVLGILHDLEINPEIVEMINADAIKTAAQALNIVASTIGDLIQRVVGEHLNKLQNATRIIERITFIRKSFKDLKQSLIEPKAIEQSLIESKAIEQSLFEPKAIEPKAIEQSLFEPIAFEPKAISDLRSIIKSGSKDEFETAFSITNMVDLNIPEFVQSLKTLESWAIEQCATYGKLLNRMRDNIREGQCQCCTISFEKSEGVSSEAAYVLSECCQIIVCESCIILKKKTGKEFIKRCPNCSANINIKSGLVRIGVELDLDLALSNEIIIDTINEDIVEPTIVESIIDESTSIKQLFDNLNNPKLKALIQFIKGHNIDCIHDNLTPPYITGLLDGKLDIPFPLDKIRKYMIFTMYPESTQILSSTLEKFGLPCCILRGSRTQKDQCVATLRDSNDINIMIITSAADCGGLNLPFISHVLFYHIVIDKNVEAQVAGRGQRIGRKHNLEIITFMNNSESLHL